MFNKLFLLPGLVLVVVASLLVLRDEPAMAALRQAEALWRGGRITEARQQFITLEQDGPPIVHVRLAQISLLRGECDKAQRYVAAAFRSAARRPLRRDEAALAHLVAGQCAALANNVAYAESEWAAIDPRSPLRVISHVLRGEYALRMGRQQEAKQHYTVALRMHLLEPARSLTLLRMALLEAADASVAAQQHLDQIGDVMMAMPSDLRPFMALNSDQIVAQARQLAAILAEEPTARLQLLGQQLLGLELEPVAIDRFEAIPATGPGVVLGRGYAAWARWRSGQKDAAILQLRELQAYASEQPFVATLYATMMIDQGALDEADAALNAAEAAHPLDPAIMLVRADVLAARRDYAGAVAERRRAFELAAPEARARYALALAELHLSLTYQPCDAGIEAARTATSLAANDVVAWRMQSELLYHCRQFAGAADAARRGLDLESDNAALEFFLGAALWDSNQRRSGREHLRRAADLAPASEWRRRAEELLLSSTTSGAMLAGKQATLLVHDAECYTPA